MIFHGNCSFCLVPLVKKLKYKYDGGLVFCDESCYTNYRRQNVWGQDTSEHKEVYCDFCGKLLKQKPSRLKNYKSHFCNNRCSGRFRGKQVLLECTGCGKKFYRKNYHAKWKKNRKGERVPIKFHFCTEECKETYQWLYANDIGDNDEYRKWLDTSGRFVLFALRQKAVAASTVYTGGLLRLLLAYQGENCAFPGCEMPLGTRGPKSKWNCCSKHVRAVNNAVFKAERRRRVTLARFGLNPI